MKQFVYAIASTLYMTVKPSKPFNPVMGETYEGFMSFEDEIFNIYAEQTSHHPPISHFLIESSMIQISGHLELKGALSGNTYTIQNKGKCSIEFLDTKQKIEYALP